MAQKTKAELLEEIEAKEQEIKSLQKEVKKLEKYKQYEDMSDELKAMTDSLVNAGYSEEQAFKLTMKLLEVGATVIAKPGIRF